MILEAKLPKETNKTHINYISLVLLSIYVCIHFYHKLSHTVEQTNEQRHPLFMDFEKCHISKEKLSLRKYLSHEKMNHGDYVMMECYICTNITHGRKPQ